jgi:hypothetical protein
LFVTFECCVTLIIEITIYWLLFFIYEVSLKYKFIMVKWITLVWLRLITLDRHNILIIVVYLCFCYMKVIYYCPFIRLLGKLLVKIILSLLYIRRIWFLRFLLKSCILKWLKRSSILQWCLLWIFSLKLNYVWWYWNLGLFTTLRMNIKPTILYSLWLLRPFHTETIVLIMGAALKLRYLTNMSLTNRLRHIWSHKLLYNTLFIVIKLL